TRSTRDWSSDVCSSDLEGDVPEEMKKAMESHYVRGKQFYDLGQYKRAEVEFQLVVELNRAFRQVVELLEKCKSKLADYVSNKLRSEERRVGKEERSRVW